MHFGNKVSNSDFVSDRGLPAKYWYKRLYGTEKGLYNYDSDEEHHLQYIHLLT